MSFDLCKTLDLLELRVEIDKMVRIYIFDGWVGKKVHLKIE